MFNSMTPIVDSFSISGRISIGDGEYPSYMSIHSKIKEGRVALGESEETFGKRFGVSRGTVQQWEREGGTAPKRTRMAEVSEALNLTINKLVGDDANIASGPDIRSVRMYPVISCVQAGDWTDIYDNFQPGDADEWRESHKDLGANGYVLRVQGDSMTGSAGAEYSFPAGFLLYVNPSLDALPGKFVIVRREGEQKATFKRYVMVDGEPYLEALNPMWPNRYLKLLKGDVFCGVVVHAGRDLP